MGNPEDPAKGYDFSKIPEGVPGDRDNLFSHLSMWDHARLEETYGTDDPEELRKMFTGPARLSFIEAYGDPREIIREPSGREEQLEKRSHEDRIAKLKQLRILEGQWNQEVDQLLRLQVSLTENERVVADTEDDNPLLHPLSAIQRHRALEAVQRLRNLMIASKHRLKEMRGIIDKLGFKPIEDDCTKYEYKEFNDHK